MDPGGSHQAQALPAPGYTEEGAMLAQELVAPLEAKVNSLEVDFNTLDTHYEKHAQKAEKLLAIFEMLKETKAGPSEALMNELATHRSTMECIKAKRSAISNRLQHLGQPQNPINVANTSSAMALSIHQTHAPRGEPRQGGSSSSHQAIRTGRPEFQPRSPEIWEREELLELTAETIQLAKTSLEEAFPTLSGQILSQDGIVQGIPLTPVKYNPEQLTCFPSLKRILQDRVRHVLDFDLDEILHSRFKGKTLCSVHTIRSVSRIIAAIYALSRFIEFGMTPGQFLQWRVQEVHKRQGRNKMNTTKSLLQAISRPADSEFRDSCLVNIIEVGSKLYRGKDTMKPAKNLKRPRDATESDSDSE